MLGEACGGLGSFQFDGGSLLIASQLPLYKEPGIRSVYGVSLWNHWLPGMVVTGCPGTHYSNTNHPGPHQDVTQHENLVGSATLIEGIL